MDINKMAGWCLILFAVINVLHEITVRSVARGNPGMAYALATSVLFTAGVVLLMRRKVHVNSKSSNSNHG